MTKTLAYTLLVIAGLIALHFRVEGAGFVIGFALIGLL